MSLETFLVERDGPVAIVTLNRPKALNALSRLLLTELSASSRDRGHDACGRS